MTLTDAQKAAIVTALSSAIRHGLALLGGILLARGWIGKDDLDALPVTEVSLGLASFAVSYLLSLANAWWAKKRTATALAMPPESTPADVKAVMAATQPGILPTAPAPTPAAAAAIVAEVKP